MSLFFLLNLQCRQDGIILEKDVYTCVTWQRRNNWPGDKSPKIRLTMLLGRNLAGDFKLKSVLIYQAENPKVLMVKIN